MDWTNSIIDGLPQHNQEVLISVNGINYIALYNADKMGFTVRDMEKLFFINNNEQPIYWKKITKP
jgi:hypothetical protein